VLCRYSQYHYTMYYTIHTYTYDIHPYTLYIQ
jgi:hypothetical protein